MDNDYAQEWDKVYQEGMAMRYPSECVIRFISKNFKKQVRPDDYKVIRPAKNILDLGCGNGANVLYLRALGYNCYGVDISKKAVDLGNYLLRKKGFPESLICGDMEKVDFRLNSFDIVISHAALDHIKIGKYKKIINKVKRLLVKGGYIFITLRGLDAYRCEKKVSKEIEHHTLITAQARKLDSPFKNLNEKGVPQHFFTLEEIKDSLKGFKILAIEKTVDYAWKKLKYADSRWFITAKKAGKSW